MPLRADNASQRADALVWAADRGARVVSISQGTDTTSPTELNGLGYAYDAGLVVVGTTGNSDSTPIWYPAGYLETIAVGATDSLDQRAAPYSCAGLSGSNYGPLLDVVAPGDLITGAIIGGYSPSLCGTSFSTPLVAGLAGTSWRTPLRIAKEESGPRSNVVTVS